MSKKYLSEVEIQEEADKRYNECIMPLKKIFNNKIKICNQSYKKTNEPAFLVMGQILQDMLVEIYKTLIGRSKDCKKIKETSDMMTASLNFSKEYQKRVNGEVYDKVYRELENLREEGYTEMMSLLKNMKGGQKS